MLKVVMRRSLMLWLGILLFVVGAMWSAIFHWEPVQSSIGPAPGVYRSPIFKADFDGRYDIGLEVQRTLRYADLNCLIGWLEVRDTAECKGKPSKVDMTWRVLQDNIEVAHGHSSDLVEINDSTMSLGGWISDDAIYRVIGRFHGKRGQQYIVEINLIDDIQHLSNTYPKLSIRVPSLTREGDLLMAALIQFIGVLLIVIGATTLAFHIYRTLYRKAS